MNLRPTWYSFADYLIEQFPSLKDEIEASYLEWTEVIANPFPHFFIEEFIIPILIGNAALNDRESRLKAGAILDELLQAPDDDLGAAVLTSVIEMLRDEPELRAKALPFLGPVASDWLEKLTPGA